MSIAPKLPLPNDRRELADLLSRDYGYRDSIEWKEAGDDIWTYAVPIRDMDPTMRINGVWGYIVKYRARVVRDRGTPMERAAYATRIPRRGFANEAKAIDFARRKIDAANEPDVEFDDSAFLGDPEDRKSADSAYRDYALGRGSVEEWEAARLKLPR